MVAAVDLVEIGDHCMFANGCFVTDGNHRFDDPDRPVPWQGFSSKGADPGRRQRLVRRQRRHHQRRDRGRALRDRRQQRRHGGHPAVLPGGGRPARVLRRICLTRSLASARRCSRSTRRCSSGSAVQPAANHSERRRRRASAAAAPWHRGRRARRVGRAPHGRDSGGGSRRGAAGGVRPPPGVAKRVVASSDLSGPAGALASAQPLPSRDAAAFNPSGALTVAQALHQR
jgi:hypothetical protein